MQSSPIGPNDDAIPEEHAAVHHHTLASAGAGAGANADVTSKSNKDDSTQFDANDMSNGSSDEIDADVETMNREMERYVSRSPPYNPAAGNQVRNPPRSQGVATNNPYRPPGASKSRPAAVTANVGTTAQSKRK